MAQKLKVSFRGKLIAELIAGDVNMDEAQRLEDTTGMTYNEMIEGYSRSSAKAVRALVWFCRVRAGEQADLWENFKFSDVETEGVDIPDPTTAAPGGKKDPETRNVSETADSGTSPS